MEPIDLAWDDDAWDAYQAARPQPALFEALTARLTDLAHHPGDARFRRSRMQRPPLFVVPVTTPAEEWVIMWDAAPDGVPQVWHVGPSPFAAG